MFLLTFIVPFCMHIVNILKCYQYFFQFGNERKTGLGVVMKINGT